MKITIPSINYYDGEMISSVDFQKSSEKTYCLATGSVTSELRLWTVQVDDEGAAQVNYHAELQKHDSSISVVRFSPSGAVLASGDMNSNIFLWCREDEANVKSDDQSKGWRVFRTLTCHMPGSDLITGDVVDLCWSNDDGALVSASLNGAVMLWATDCSKPAQIFQCANTIPKGVAYLVEHHSIAALCEDRTMRVFYTNGKKPMVIARAHLPLGQDEGEQKSTRLFCAHHWALMHRRPAFSPDGKLLVAPGGAVALPSNKGVLQTSYVYSTANLRKPLAILPSENYHQSAVRFCPIAFEPNRPSTKPLIDQPYRFVFAIVQRQQLLLYDTEQCRPIAGIANAHYANLTDVSWSSDGLLLCVSSADGYLSFCSFAPGELGKLARLSFSDQPKEEVTKALAHGEAADTKQDKLSTTLLNYFSTPNADCQGSAQKKRRIVPENIVSD